MSVLCFQPDSVSCSLNNKAMLILLASGALQSVVNFLNSLVSILVAYPTAIISQYHLHQSISVYSTVDQPET